MTIEKKEQRQLSKRRSYQIAFFSESEGRVMA
jgi:hypothetical protein